MNLVIDKRGELSKKAELKRILVILGFVLVLLIFFVSANKFGLTGFATLGNFSTNQSCLNDSDCDDGN